MKKIAVNFVHGYNDENIILLKEQYPALLIIDNKDKEILSYPFPRNVEDYNKYDSVINGTPPLQTAKNFKKLPRFGFTGIAQNEDFLYSGSWNGVYKISKETYQLDSIISNNMMSDLHGICIHEDEIITILTGKDTVVFTDQSGEIKDHFTINPDLSISKNTEFESIDWRFLSKQFRGSTGNWHFNYVQIIGDEVWLTARNTNCFVVVNRKTKKARLKMMNLCTPVLLHDGKYHSEEFYFTSIDGKIIIAGEKLRSNYDRNNYEINDITQYNRDLVSQTIRIQETNYGREPNWCRGIEIHEDRIFCTIDGRYDSDLSFGILELSRTGKAKEITRLKWDEIGNADDIRYVTGFDLVVF